MQGGLGVLRKVVVSISLVLILGAAGFAYTADSAGMKPGFDPAKNDTLYPGSYTAPTPSLDLTSTLTPDSKLSNYQECPPTIVCPDINGNLPPGKTVAVCPDYCVVNRKITSDGVTGISPTISLSSPPTIVEAICPVEYKQMATFNMQSAITYNPKRIDYPPPVPDQATLDTYKTNKAVCIPYKDNAASIYSTCMTSHPFNTEATIWGVVYVAPTPIRTNQIISGSLGYYEIPPVSQHLTYLPGSDSFPACTFMMPVNLACLMDDNNGLNCQSTIPNLKFSAKLSFDVYRYMCYQPEGYQYSSTVTVPASVLCGRTSPTWYKKSQPIDSKGAALPTTLTKPSQ